MSSFRTPADEPLKLRRKRAVDKLAAELADAEQLLSEWPPRKDILSELVSTHLGCDSALRELKECEKLEDADSMPKLNA